MYVLVDWNSSEEGYRPDLPDDLAFAGSGKEVFQTFTLTATGPKDKCQFPRFPLPLKTSLDVEAVLSV